MKKYWRIVGLFVITVLGLFGGTGCALLPQQEQLSSETEVQLSDKPFEDTTVVTGDLKTETTEESTETSTEKTKKETEKNPFEISDIDWSVSAGILDGERYLLFRFTNNTPYAIRYINLKFSEGSGNTAAEKEAFYSDMVQLFELDEDEAAELPDRDIEMYAECESVIEPGETSADVHVYYYSGWYYVREASHFNLVEPDIAEIRYISEGKIYTVYYDFLYDGFTVERTTEDAFQWTDFPIGALVPRPESYVEVNSERDDWFSFTVLHVTEESFCSYKQACVNMGFTLDVYMHDDYYSADNAEGYSLSLRFDADEGTLDVSVDAPDESYEE